MQQQQQQFIQQQQQQFVGMGTHLMQMHAHLFHEQCRAKDMEAVAVKRRHDEVLKGEVARAKAELAASKAEAAEALEKATTARDQYKGYVVQLEGAVRGSFVRPMLEEVLKGSLSVHMLFKYPMTFRPVCTPSLSACWWRQLSRTGRPCRQSLGASEPSCCGASNTAVCTPAGRSSTMTCWRGC